MSKFRNIAFVASEMKEAQGARRDLVARYGEYVLLNPVMGPHTLLLWIAAPVVLVIGGVVVFIGARRKRVAGQTALIDATGDQKNPGEGRGFLYLKIELAGLAQRAEVISSPGPDCRSAS